MSNPHPLPPRRGPWHYRIAERMAPQAKIPPAWRDPEIAVKAKWRAK